MKELIRFSFLIEVASIKLKKIKLPKVLVDELVPLVQKIGKVVDAYLDEEIKSIKEDDKDA